MKKKFVFTIEHTDLLADARNEVINTFLLELEQEEALKLYASICGCFDTWNDGHGHEYYYCRANEATECSESALLKVVDELTN